MKTTINQIRKTIDTNVFLSLSVFVFLISTGIFIGLLPLILTLVFLSPGWLVLIIPLTVYSIFVCGIFLPLEVMMWVEEWN